MLNEKQTKVLVIGLDGGTLDLLRPWVEEGHLPVLGRLMAEGAAGDLRTTTPPVTASAWMSFATGKNPGKHGLVDFFILREGEYDIKIVNATHRDGQAIWNTLSDVGRRVIVVGVPATYPPEPVNGYMVSGFMTPGPRSEYTYPPALKQELEETLGEFPFAPSEKRRAGELEFFLEDMKRCAEARTDTALYLMRKGDWSFFSIVYSSTDMVQHELWHLMDETDHRYDPEEAAAARDLILDFYRTVDDCMGKLLAEAGDDRLVVVMSDHGFGPTYYFFHANNWLVDIGMLKFKRRPLTQVRYALFKLGFTPFNAFRMLNRLGLGGLRENVKSGQGHGLLSRLFLSYLDIDWSRTKAFVVGSCGKTYVNLVGKRPQGIVQPGAEYEAVRQKLIEEAFALRNPYTGQPVIERAYKKEETYHGPHVDALPDLTFDPLHWEYTPFGDVEFASNCIIEPILGQTGTHRMEGMLVMSGAGIKAGTALQEAEIIDLAPTILYAMGNAIPSDMDGKVLTQAFDPEFLARNSIEYADPAAEGRTKGDDYSQEDEQAVRERLRAMGYVA